MLLDLFAHIVRHLIHPNTTKQRTYPRPERPIFTSPHRSRHNSPAETYPREPSVDPALFRCGRLLVAVVRNGGESQPQGDLHFVVSPGSPPNRARVRCFLEKIQSHDGPVYTS